MRDPSSSIKKIHIQGAPIGKGVERNCFVHPEDVNKAIKIPFKAHKTQTKREINYYRELEKRCFSGFTHIPKYYGLINTNHGEGFIVDLIRDGSGEISKSLKWYLDNGWKIDSFRSHIDDLKAFFINHLLIFNYDMYADNILVQFNNGKISRLVLIDGIGDVVLIKILNFIPALLVKKLMRRWSRFVRNLNRYLEKTGHGSRY